MDEQEILLQEYNNLWNEKILHKQSIRKFHNYLSYMTAIGSLALSFHGISAQDFFKAGLDQETTRYLIKNADSIVNLIFIVFTPIVAITLTFPLNDIFHIFVMGNRIGELERRINGLYGNTLLAWESAICKIVYGGKKINLNGEKHSVLNVISFGDYTILVPAIGGICLFTSIKSAIFIYNNMGCILFLLYCIVSLYLLGIILLLALKIRSYTKADGLITKVVQEASLP
jgi:hypothetical protein